MSMIEVLDPTVAPPVARPIFSSTPPEPRSLGALRGRHVGIRHDSLWKSFDVVANTWATLLEADGAEVELWCSDARVDEAGAKVTASFQAFLGRIDAGIFGLGSCGSCTMLTVSDAVDCRELDRPSIPVVTDHFVTLGQALLDRAGRTDMSMQVLPYPLEGRSDEELQAIARESYRGLLSLLGAAA
jgi:hypothetical protein